MLHGVGFQGDRRAGRVDPMVVLRDV